MKIKYFLIAILSILIIYIGYLCINHSVSLDSNSNPSIYLYSNCIVIQYQSSVVQDMIGCVAQSTKVTISNNGEYSYVNNNGLADSDSWTKKNGTITEETLKEIENICLNVVSDYEKENSTTQHYSNYLTDSYSLTYNGKEYTITHDIFSEIFNLIF